MLEGLLERNDYENEEFLEFLKLLKRTNEPITQEFTPISKED